VEQFNCLFYRENQVLWREVASLRQMHMKQQHVVSKVTFLSSFHCLAWAEGRRLLGAVPYSSYAPGELSQWLIHNVQADVIFLLG